MNLDPDQLSQPERYKLLIGAIVPRPIAFVSTIGPNGATNLAPFSFFAGVGSEPMSLVFCPANKADGTIKDTFRNCLPRGHADLAGLLQEHAGQGEFVVNVVHESIARQMAACAEELAFGQSEFELSGLTPAPSSKVAPPRVAESPLSFECRTMEIVRLAPGAPGGGNLVIGRVVGVFANEGVLNECLHVDPDALRAIARMGGSTYCRTHDRFDMPMGRAALLARSTQ